MRIHYSILPHLTFADFLRAGAAQPLTSAGDPLKERAYPMSGAVAGTSRAQMAELVDAPASGAGARKGVEVRVLFWAPVNHFIVLFLHDKVEFLKI